jgi:hypothetical protein
VRIGSQYGAHTPTSSTTYTLTKVVSYIKEIQGLHVYNAGISVTIGDEGEVVGVTYSLRTRTRTGRDGQNHSAGTGIRTVPCKRPHTTTCLLYSRLRGEKYLARLLDGELNRSPGIRPAGVRDQMRFDDVPCAGCRSGGY